MQLTVIPVEPNSTASDFVNPITPCFAEVYGDCLGVAPNPSVDEIFTILPDSDFCIYGNVSLIN